MKLPAPRPNASDPWAPYAPTANTPWNRRRVVHLHRRAGFAATRDEAARDFADGPKASIDRLLAGKARAYGVPERFDATASLLADAAVASNDPPRPRAWWVDCMLFGPDPLGERLVLMWHDHFVCDQQGNPIDGGNPVKDLTLRPGETREVGDVTVR